MDEKNDSKKKLTSVRPPRVHITYEVEIEGAMVLKELPFVIGVLSDLSGQPDETLPKLRNRTFVEIDRYNFDQILMGMKPRLAYTVDNKLTDDDTKLAVELRFKNLDDFHPEKIVLQIDPLRRLLLTRDMLYELSVPTNQDLPRGTGEEFVNILKEIIHKAEAAVSLKIEPSIQPNNEDDLRYSKNMIEYIGSDPETREKVVHKVMQIMIDEYIARIDGIISLQLNEILHASEFQKLEASWRGLYYLVAQSQTGESLKIRVLNTSRKDLLKDMEKASEFDQSALFKEVYQVEYGTFAGYPYAVLIGDYEFGENTQDISLLGKISTVAAAAHAPFISAASCQLFNLESFTDLGKPRDLTKIFDNRRDSKYIKWRSFRESEDSRFVGLTMPHILMRLPYGKEMAPVERFDFEEDVTGKEHSKYLWGNAAYAFGARLTAAFAKYGWCAAISGVEGGGLVEDLPIHCFQTDEGEVALKCPTEIAITEPREKELSDLGFISLVHCKGTDLAAFFNAQSTHKPRKYDTDEAYAKARLSTQLQYILANSRFAHYLKVMMRDKEEKFMARQHCEDFLNNWISQYVLLDVAATPENKARYPLREARIDVIEVTGRPGVNRAVAFLQPQFPKWD